MPLVQDFTNPYLLTDYTEAVNIIPTQIGLVNSMGLFSEQAVASNTITFEQTLGTIGIIGDKIRGDKNYANKDDTRRAVAFSLAHFPIQDQVTGAELAGRRAYNSINQADTETAVIARKLERIRKSYAQTLEVSRVHTLVNGTVYAPNGTVSSDFYTVFGITRKEVDFVLGTAGTEVLEKIEEGLASIMDNLLSGSLAGGFVALCSPQFFSKLIRHPKVAAAYQFYSSTQEPARNRLGGTSLYRSFEFGGCQFVEYRGNYQLNGVTTQIIPAGEAYLMPTNTDDAFITYYGPASKLGMANTLGMPLYTWAYRDISDEFIRLEAESNMLHLLARPASVVKLFSSN